MDHVSEGCRCEGKWCPQCKHLRCRLDYTKDKKRRDGLDAWCRHCNNAKRKLYREANRGKARQAQEKSYRKNLSHYREYQKTYRQTYGDEITRKIREAKYYTSEKTKKRKRLYKQTKWREQNRRECHMYRARKRGVGGTYTVLEWIALKVQYNNACLCCGRQEPEIKLTVDHIIPISLGGRNSIDNIQPLCLSCNSSKQAKIIDYRR